MDETSQNENLTGPADEGPAPLRKRLLRKLMILLSVLLVLFVCVVILVFVIPRTNIYRLENGINEKLNQYLPAR